MKIGETHSGSVTAPEARRRNDRGDGKDDDGYGETFLRRLVALDLHGAPAAPLGVLTLDRSAGRTRLRTTSEHVG
ncbi:MAG TPA: hypothetical protein VIJ33_08045 [Solirubrobacteraceae bacterium]